MSYESGVLSLIKRLVKGSKLTKAEMDQNLTDIEAAVADRYTKSEVDSALSGKASTSHTHSMSEVSGLSSALSGKANSSHTHSIGEISALSSTIASLEEGIANRMQHILVHVSADYDELPKMGHTVIFADATGGDIFINLDLSSQRRMVTVIKTDSSINLVTLDPQSPRTIESASTEDITTQYGKLKLVFDGVDTWYKL